MLNALAPIVEKLSRRLWFIASMAVIMPISAIIPKAIIATVIPVLSLLLLTVLNDKANVSDNRNGLALMVD